MRLSPFLKVDSRVNGPLVTFTVGEGCQPVESMPFLIWLNRKWEGDQTYKKDLHVYIVRRTTNAQNKEVSR